MKVAEITIRNFRRLEEVVIDIDEKETVFVGPNNSGKTSATAAFRSFLDGREFKIHDYSVSQISSFDKFGESGESSKLPKIELDIWLAIDPNSIAFGRAFSLLPRLAEGFDRLGLRLSFGISDPAKLLDNYRTACPLKDGQRAKTLAQYLAIDANLKRHSQIIFASLEKPAATPEQPIPSVIASPLPSDEGKKLLSTLIRVDFVDAQRNIDDDDSSRSNRLSAAFGSYYRKNLEQAEIAETAHRVIDENNRSLTGHYETQFAPLIKLIKGLGVPSINDRDLKIISSLSPETALRGNTELLYIDATLQHELPELYNGLGFKNLIYMAIQARHFHSQWLSTAENRPLCQMIFIEEPEVHLHAQVQQTFITNIWSVIEQSAKDSGEQSLVPQLLITTHSSHILDAVDFSKVRYFRRCQMKGEKGPPGILNASEVRSLKAFTPEPENDDGRTISSQDALSFLKKYLRLTHCDLFFADGAILVEGAVEKLLLPTMLERDAPELRSAYLSILEVGGAYAHRFEGLLSFLRIPYLVITDLDSVTPAGRPKSCKANVPGARTSNATLKKLCGLKTVQELVDLDLKSRCDQAKDRYVTYQGDVSVTDDGKTQLLRPRTLEEAIAYENFDMLRAATMSIGIDIPSTLDEAYENIFNHIGSDNFKKTDFAMSVLAGPDTWKTPRYITDGLDWLKKRLCPPKLTPGPGPAAGK